MGLDVKGNEISEGQYFYVLKNYEEDIEIKLDDFNQKFDCNLVDNDIETIGGFLVNKFEKVPKKQETLESGGFLFTVLSADSKKINRIQITIKKN